MSAESQESLRSKRLKVWTLMAATLIFGMLLAFGRWASDDPTLMGFGDVAWQAFPAGWVLSIEYGVIVFMVAALIRADRVDAFFSSTATLIWLGAIGLFTAGLYHDHHFLRWGTRADAVWAGSVNGYGSFTQLLKFPSLYALSHVLAGWPMAYGMVAATTSFVTLMGWKRPFLSWRWILPALFLAAVTGTWIALYFVGYTESDASLWLGGSFVILPALALILVLVRNPERKIDWMNLLAAAWLALALVPQLDIGGYVLSIPDALARMYHGYRILLLGDLLLAAGSVAVLLASRATRVDRPAPGP
jgi:hypothetical protein